MAPPSKKVDLFPQRTAFSLKNLLLPIIKKKAKFFGNNTVNQRFGANLKKMCFLQKFSCKFPFFSFLSLKTLKMTISTSIWSAQHPNAGWNIQQVCKVCSLPIEIHNSLRLISRTTNGYLISSVILCPAVVFVIKSQV